MVLNDPPEFDYSELSAADCGRMLTGFGINLLVRDVPSVAISYRLCWDFRYCVSPATSPSYDTGKSYISCMPTPPTIITPCRHYCRRTDPVALEQNCGSIMWTPIRRKLEPGSLVRWCCRAVPTNPMGCVSVICWIQTGTAGYRPFPCRLRDDSP